MCEVDVWIIVLVVLCIASPLLVNLTNLGLKFYA